MFKANEMENKKDLILDATITAGVNLFPLISFSLTGILDRILKNEVCVYMHISYVF